MLQDAKLLFAEDKALPSDTNAADSTNNIDLGGSCKDGFGNSITKDLANGQPLYIYIAMTVAAESSGSMTTSFALQDSADDSSYTAVSTLLSAVPKATLTAGYIKKFLLPNSLRRYIKLVVTNAVAGATAGKYTAWIAPE